MKFFFDCVGIFYVRSYLSSLSIFALVIFWHRFGWLFEYYNLSIDVLHGLTLNSSMKPRSLFCLFCATYSLNFVTAIGFNGVKVHCAFLTKTENNRVKGVQLRSFFWSVFFLLWTEYGNLRRNLRRMQENMDQKKLSNWTIFTKCMHERND